MLQRRLAALCTTEFYKSTELDGLAGIEAGLEGWIDGLWVAVAGALPGPGTGGAAGKMAAAQAAMAGTAGSDGLIKAAVA